MDENDDKKVTLQEYITAIKKHPNLLDVFDFINQGLADTIASLELTNLMHRELNIA